MDAKKISKIVLAAVAVTVFGIVWSMLACGWLFKGLYEIEPVNVWVPMENVSMVTLNLGSLVLNVIFVGIYAVIKKGLPGRGRVAKGLIYGLFVWALGMLPGMFFTYLFMTVAWQVLLYWTISGLLQKPICGLLAAAIYGDG